MSNSSRQIIAVALVPFILVVMYVGTHLPFRKARLFIAAQSNPARTFEEYNAQLDKALDTYSPIGQEETLLNYLYFVSDIVPQVKEEEIVHILVEKAERHAEPIIARGPGLNLVQILYQLGIVYKRAGMRLEDETYIKKAIEAFELGRVYSPKRPIFLQELFNLYRERGEKEKLEEIARVIVSLWPDQEEEVRQLIEEMMGRRN